MTYVAAITAILARYPEEVITSVTHPATGLPSKKGWLPTVKEVTDACNEVMEPIVQNELRLKRVKDQLETMQREAKRERPTLDELQAKYGMDWGLNPEPDRPAGKTFKAPSKDDLEAHYREYGLAFQPKLKIEVE